MVASDARSSVVGKPDSPSGARRERIKQVGLLRQLGSDLRRYPAVPEFPQPLRRNPHSFRIQIVAEKAPSKPQGSTPHASRPHERVADDIAGV
jgi:hypothetical protein